MCLGTAVRNGIEATFLRTIDSARLAASGGIVFIPAIFEFLGLLMFYVTAQPFVGE